MQEQQDKSKKKKRKKKGFGYYLYAVVVLVLTIANITLATLLLTYVQKMDVTGTQYSDKGEILEWFQEDPLTKNSLYSFWKVKSGSYTKPVYLESVDLRFKAPWEICLEVKEKQIIGGIAAEGSYAYIDQDGLVLLISTETVENIPIIEGLQAKNTKQYEILEVEDEKVFKYMARVSEAIEKNELSPNRIAWEDDSMNLYFEQICVCLGKSNYDEKLVQLAAVLELGTLDGKNGTIHLEHYSDISGNISFEEFIDEPETGDDNAESGENVESSDE